ncbi:putative methyltransferase domain-containing protein [Zalerion maritima]|uniref:Methyltransferase domain-containing protein n=1 Tax=Zalerion maritima TaxID=339359 RepID=A0AAD5RGX8_9PEZI|nr:putative methyltransferase domain-containing protein [Zalerion maritima]
MVTTTDDTKQAKPAALEQASEATAAPVETKPDTTDTTEATIDDTPAATTKTSGTTSPIEGHIQTAERVPIYSWEGSEQSEPSPPSIDSNELYRDDDSAFESVRSSTVSVSSSVYEVVEENGRTYHKYKEGKYHFPNDAVDLQHALFVMTVKGKLFLAPIQEDVHDVLDIGTGTGIWSIEFGKQPRGSPYHGIGSQIIHRSDYVLIYFPPKAQMFPGAAVVGTDLSPIQPHYVPPNCQFEIDDADDEWTFSTRFDFIHARAMCSCFSNHGKVIQSCFDGLAPGGWCEWQDMIFPFEAIGDIPNDSVLCKWTGLICDAAEKIGRPWHNATRYKQYFKDAGFENVVERRFYWPIGLWAKGDYYKSIAVYFLEDIRRGMEPISMKLLPLLGWTQDEIHVLLAKVRQELIRPEVHAYLNVTFVYGQKPGAPVPKCEEEAPAA